MEIHIAVSQSSVFDWFNQPGFVQLIASFEGQSFFMKLSEIPNCSSEILLRFKPRYGWGWQFPKGTGVLDYEVIEKLGSFSLRAKKAFQWKGVYRGVIGDITEENHPLCDYRFVLWSMTGADADLVQDSESRWDIYFSKQQFNEDGIDFVQPDLTGVGYGAPFEIRLISANLSSK